MANCEYLHHQLQLGWTTWAYRKTSTLPAANITGVIVVAASDGGKLVRLDPQYASDAFWSRILASCRKSTKAQPMMLSDVPTSLPLWPEAEGKRIIQQALGVTVIEIVGNGRVARTSCGGVAVACTKPHSDIKNRDFKRMQIAAAAVGGKPAWYIYPSPSGWKIHALPAMKRKQV